MIIRHVDSDKSAWDLYMTCFENDYKTLFNTYTSYTTINLNYGQQSRIILLETLESKNHSEREHLSHMETCGNIAEDDESKRNESMSAWAD